MLCINTTNGQQVRIFTCIECGSEFEELPDGGYPACMCCTGPMCDACELRPGVYGRMNLCSPCEQAVRNQAQATSKTVTPMTLPPPPIQRTVTYRLK